MPHFTEEETEGPRAEVIASFDPYAARLQSVNLVPGTDFVKRGK